MPKLNFLLVILTLLVIESVGWADHRPRCGLGFGRGNHTSIFSRLVRRRRCIHPSPPIPDQCVQDQYVTLAWKLEKGKPFYQERTTETVQTMTILGQSITQKQKVTWFLSWTPVGRDQIGNWKVKQKIDAVKMEIEIGGNKIPFDSTKDETAANPLSSFFKAMVGSEFLLTIDKEMKVSKIEGRDEFLKKLGKENQQTPLLQSIISDEALKQMSDRPSPRSRVNRSRKATPGIAKPR